MDNKFNMEFYLWNCLFKGLWKIEKIYITVNKIKIFSSEIVIYK